MTALKKGKCLNITLFRIQAMEKMEFAYLNLLNADKTLYKSAPAVKGTDAPVMCNPMVC